MYSVNQDIEEDKFLQYQVHKWSSYSSKYIPENILHNKPNQQSSRWSSATNYPPQFLVLKLVKPAIVKTIIFGKYEKTHVCNLKKFKVLGGMEENNLIEILQGGLKNNNHAETFQLKYKINGQVFPCKYIKIVPILSWGQSFNFSIWYVEFRGQNSEESVQSRLEWYYKHREQEAVRLCLKHFRQHNYTEAFESLQKKTKINLEHPLLTQLHDELVKKGNFGECENTISRALKEGFFEEYINKQEYQAYWELVEPKPPADNIPRKRGGHQMCFDYCKNTVYLFGGWDGQKDLADMWKFDVSEHLWHCLSLDTEQDGGPSARSCHKICIDCESGKIYTLGRYLDADKRTSRAVQNDFHVYSIADNEWTLISQDVASDGGPRLLFDHQMCFDEDNHDIFVFGGRIINAAFPIQNERQTIEFSGLYKYHITTNSWQLLREDSGNAGPQDIRSRNGHSILFDKRKRSLYVIGGQRGKEYLNDFFVYDIDKDSVKIIYDGTHKEGCGLPPPGFTQRATINSELGEIHVLVGLSKDKEKNDESSMHNSFWVYNIEQNTWICFYTNEQTTDSSSSSKHAKSLLNSEPCPRYAHQLVYNHITKTHFMFGGNPGNRNNKLIRLNDFWSLKIFRLRGKDILRKCLYMIRCHHFKEKTLTDPLNAIEFLQTKLHDTVNHDNVAESYDFRKLASYLFGGSPHENDKDTQEKCRQPAFSSLLSIPTTSNNSVSLCNLLFTDVEEAYAGRTKLYDSLVSFFPEEMVQPKENLVDLITF